MSFPIPPALLGGAVSLVGSVMSGAQRFIRNATVGLTRGNNDTATIADRSRYLAEALSSVSSLSPVGVKPRSDGMIHLEDIQDQVAADLAVLEEMIGRIISASGLGTVNDLLLQVDSDGRVIVDENSPEMRQLQDLINQSPKAVSLLQQVSANMSVIEAGKNVENLQQALRANPGMAIPEPSPALPKIRLFAVS